MVDVTKMTDEELEAAADAAVDAVDMLCLSAQDPIDEVEWLAELSDELKRRGK